MLVSRDPAVYESVLNSGDVVCVAVNTVCVMVTRTAHVSLFSTHAGAPAAQPANSAQEQTKRASTGRNMLGIWSRSRNGASLCLRHADGTPPQAARRRSVAGMRQRLERDCVWRVRMLGSMDRDQGRVYMCSPSQAPHFRHGLL